VFVYGLEGEAALGHFDQGQSPGWLGRVALEPFVDGLVGHAQVRVMGAYSGQSGH